MYFLDPNSVVNVKTLFVVHIVSEVNLFAGAASSQEQLAVAAQNAVSTIVQLAEVVKFGAASLGSNNPEAQVCSKF